MALVVLGFGKQHSQARLVKWRSYSLFRSYTQLQRLYAALTPLLEQQWTVAPEINRWDRRDDQLNAIELSRQNEGTIRAMVHYWRHGSMSVLRAECVVGHYQSSGKLTIINSILGTHTSLMSNNICGAFPLWWQFFIPLFRQFTLNILKHWLL